MGGVNKSLKSQYQSEQDIEHRHIEIPRLVHCNAQSTLNNKQPANSSNCYNAAGENSSYRPEEINRR